MSLPAHELNENRAPRFISLSIAVHVAFAYGVLFLAASSLFEKPKFETVTIELADGSGGTGAGLSLPDAPPAPTPAPEPEVLPPAPEPIAKNDVVVPAKPVEKPREIPPKPAPKAPKVVAAKPAPVKTAPAPVAPPVESLAEHSDVEVPARLDDIETPALDEKPTQSQPVAKMNDEDLDESLSAVDSDHAQKAALVRKEFNEDAANAEQEQDQALNSAEEDNAREAAVLAAKAEEMKKKNAAQAAAIAAARAREEEAAQKAAAAAAAASATKAAQESQGQGEGEEGPGAGAQGAAVAGQVGGSPGGVRSLDQLRQVPGNPRPRYSEQERRAGQTGDVVYLAYVQKDGLPTQFRQVKSTGYANLDSKTLDALKQWKFYPGQEGWVEIPFRWDLRGGPQESSALGRRKVSQQTNESF